MDDKNFCFRINDSIFVRLMTMRKISVYLIVLLFSSCKLPSRMFQTPENYEFASDTSSSQTPYIIQPSDKLELHIFSNDGFKLVDITQSTTFGTAQTDVLHYLVEQNGEAKFPVIGRVPVAQLTIKDAEDFLQQKYSRYYNEPFVVLKVVNRHAIVFIGESGHGALINLENDNTTIFEALAMAGGITEYSRTYNIKILRGDPKNPKVYKANLSNIADLQHSELKVLSNDIIYVDNGINYSKKIASDIIPILGIITSFLVIYTNIIKK